MVGEKVGSMGFARTGLGAGLRAGFTAAGLLAVAPAAQAESRSDIVWPTYDRIERLSDRGLNCTALVDEIAHVGSDIRLLNTARSRVEDVLHSAFDMERYGGSNGPGGTRLHVGSVNGKEAYPKAREKIVASLKVAQSRRDYLKSLEPGCKPGPQPVAAP